MISIGVEEQHIRDLVIQIASINRKNSVNGATSTKFCHHHCFLPCSKDPSEDDALSDTPCVPHGLRLRVHAPRQLHSQEPRGSNRHVLHVERRWVVTL